MEKSFDLEERTTKFSEKLICFCKLFPKDQITIPLINQLIRSGTSVGANYQEANGASSRKDFKNKIYICKKESKETQYWIRLLAKSVSDDATIKECRTLWQEAKELSKIFSTIAIKTN